MKSFIIPLFTAFLLFRPVFSADLDLAPPFSDHAVLQRDKPLAVWGTAGAGESITVAFGGQTVNGTTDDTGKWRVQLKPLKAGATPGSLTVRSDSASITRKNILVGEVWMATGQSNMDWRVFTCRPDDVAIAMNDRFDQIRFLEVPARHSLTPDESCDAIWKLSTDKEPLKQLSGPAYFFARELHEKLKVPIGIIDPSFGGTHIDAWIAPDAWTLEPSLAETHKEQLAYPEDSKHGASRIYNALVNPFVGYTMRGFIWHQGEGNAQDGLLYKTKLHALVNEATRGCQAPYRKNRGNKRVPGSLSEKQDNKSNKRVPGSLSEKQRNFGWFDR